MKQLFIFFLFLPLIVKSQKTFAIDISVNGVELMNGKSFEKKFSKYHLPEYYEADHPPKLEFINTDKTQKFTVFHCYGSRKNDICSFRVEFRNKSDSIPFYGIVIKDKNYKTGKGIYLGMSVEEFKKKIGTIDYKSSSENGKLKIVIKLDDFKQNKFLQSYNMPEYSSEYYFEKGKLILFEFGFPNP